MDTALFSSASDEWATPAEFFGVVEREIGGFDLDPCCVPSSAKAPRFFTLADDGLAQPWAGRVWLNPPYSKISAWMAKAHATAAAGAGLVVCLVPAALLASLAVIFAVCALAYLVRIAQGGAQ